MEYCSCSCRAINRETKSRRTDLSFYFHDPCRQADLGIVRVQWFTILFPENLVTSGRNLFNEAIIDAFRKKDDEELINYVDPSHLCCRFLTRARRSTWPAEYCSITSFTSYGFKASRNFRFATKYFIFRMARMAVRCLSDNSGGGVSTDAASSSSEWRRLNLAYHHADYVNNKILHNKSWKYLWLINSGF